MTRSWDFPPNSRSAARFCSFYPANLHHKQKYNRTRIKCTLEPNRGADAQLNAHKILLKIAFKWRKSVDLIVSSLPRCVLVEVCCPL